MENKLSLAMNYHDQGYNCAQAVALPFCKELGLEESLVKRATEGFGAGMGGRTQTCGALSGAIFVAGLLHASPTEPQSKAATYQICAALSEQFVHECGAGACEDIKGLKTGTPLYSCNDCIACGIRLVESLLENK